MYKVKVGDKAIVIINNGNDVTINQKFPLTKNREERIVRMKKR